ncbi:hypothetical protein EYF80_051365 [Liparis tanakae]|uniref:Uncharacterized protein n=1 Tax=Liparis tanakae TaxID=230148 RepID=A0A4Z2FCG9_9TELE|nr:hypothetical protein EYF80_051365 [Liparis tanakae]
MRLWIKAVLLAMRVTMSSGTDCNPLRQSAGEEHWDSCGSDSSALSSRIHALVKNTGLSDHGMLNKLNLAKRSAHGGCQNEAGVCEA